MSKPISGKAEFYAFISHKSADTKFALKLRKFIESYKLPTHIRQLSGTQTKRLTPICSYEDDFSSQPLLDEMRDKLSRSKHLILICSDALTPSAAKYINYEIRTFIEHRQAEGINPYTRIIPIVVSGEFGEGPQDCRPEALKELGDNCPIALDRRKYKNDRELFLHVISSLLDIDYAVLQNRDRKRRATKSAVAAAIAAVLLGTGLGLAEYFIPRESHYVDFAMNNGLPVGIGALTKEEAQQTAKHYVITEQKHKVQSLEYVNAYGKRIDHTDSPDHGDRPAAYIFDYTDAGLSTVTYEDKAGTPIFIMQYSGSSVSAADLKTPYAPNEAYYISFGSDSDASVYLQDVNTVLRSEASGLRYQYSPQGYVTHMFYCADSTGRLAHNKSVYGMEYTVDEKGRVIETYYLDALGGRKVNSEGIFRQTFTYDAHDNLIEWAKYNRTADLVEDLDGIARCEYTYDDNHNVIAQRFFGSENTLKHIESIGAAQLQHTLDAFGNPILTELLDEQGNLSQKEDYCVIAYTYDENSFVADMTYQTAAGEPIRTTRYVNDESGNPVETIHLDSQGELANNTDGYAKLVTEYDAYGNVLKNAYFGADGNPAEYRSSGYSVMELTYDVRGRETSRSFFGKDGEPVISNDVTADYGYGFHRLEAAYEYGAHTKQAISFYDTQGQLVNIRVPEDEDGAYAQMVMYFQNGGVTYIKGLQADGSLFGEIMEVETTYSPQAEPIKTIRGTDLDGKLLTEYVLYYSINGTEQRMTITGYDTEGRVTTQLESFCSENGTLESEHGLFYDPDGTTSGELFNEYDETGLLVKSTMVYPDSQSMHTYITIGEFDANRRKTAEHFTAYRKNGTLEVDGRTLYDSDGNITEEQHAYYNTSEKLWATAVYVFNEDETISETTTFYNSGGNAFLTQQQLLDKDYKVIK